jgi:hypothetical protein
MGAKRDSVASMNTPLGSGLRIACAVSILSLVACDRSNSAANAPAAPATATPSTPIALSSATADVPSGAAIAAASTDAAALVTDAAMTQASTDAAAPAAIAAAQAASADAGAPAAIAPVGAAHASARAHERAAPNSAVAAAPVAAGEPAELRLRIVPSGSIEIDGHAAGEDFYRGNVPAGRHTVRVTNAERQASRTLTINLAPGEHAMRTIDLTRAE